MSGRFHGSARLRSFHPGAGANASAKEMTNGIRKIKKCIEHVHLIPEANARVRNPQSRRWFTGIVSSEERFSNMPLKQAVAIALSKAGKSNKKRGKKSG